MLATETPVDALENELVAVEGLIGRLRAHQAGLLYRLEEAQVAVMDGHRSMLEWTAARLDVVHDTARRLLQVARAGEPEWVEKWPEASFDRVVETLALIGSGAPEEVVEASGGYDLAGVTRLVARQRRMNRRSEQAVYRGRFVATQLNLEGSGGRIWGELPGFELKIVEDALDQRADAFRDLPGPWSAFRARRADALVSLAQDALGGGEATVTVFVDADLASCGGEAGDEMAAGDRVGPAVLERILCAGSVGAVGVKDRRPVWTTPTARAIPPAIRRLVLWRDGGCAIEGCRSRYRLQPHHIVPYSQGGSHDPDNLTTLCWYHHHVVIHGLGYRIDPDTPPQRRRFLPPDPGPDPP